MTRKELLELLDSWDACLPAANWVREQEAEATVLELWSRLIKMRRSPEEEKVERDWRAKDQSWRSDPEVHTGWAWASWLANQVGVRCGNGFYSGRRGIHPGPNADRVDPQEVLHGLETAWRAHPNTVSLRKH